jgi:hypothetical protein
LFGALAVLVALIAPDLAAALGPQTEHSVEAAGTELEAAPGVEETLDESGECGTVEEQEELVDCGAWARPHLDEPGLITMLRAVVVRVTRHQCVDILSDIWADERCQAEGRECGKMLPHAPPPPAPKLASASAFGESRWASHEIDPEAGRRLGPRAEPRPLASRDLRPPVPPPRV